MKNYLLIIAVLLIIAAGCAGPGIKEVLVDIRTDPLGGAYVENVPFFPQKDQLCGPAALASVIGYYGAKGGAGVGGFDTVARAVYHEKLKGTLPMDLIIYAREKGFNVKYYEGGLVDLKENLSAGRPVILFLNLGIPEYPVGHYVVAIGYNDRFEGVIARSGMKKEVFMSYKRLERAWSKTGYSTLVLTPALIPEGGG
jgi:hypothetical protein